MPGRKSRRSHFITVVKYGLGVGALAWVVSTADLSRALGVIGRLSVLTLGLVVAVSVVSVLARVATWCVLVAYFTDVDVRGMVMADLVIKFVNSLFPSRVSGRSIAPLALRHFTDLEWNGAMAVTVAHTGLYAVLYGTVTLVGLAVDVGTYGPGLTAVILLSVGAYLAVGCAVVLAGWRLDLFDRFVGRLAGIIAQFPAGDKLRNPLNGFRSKLLEGSDEQFQLLVRNRKAIGLFVLTWLVALMLLPAIRLWILLSATGVTGLDPLYLPLYVVVAYSVTILPLTPGGIGIAEATAVAVFVALGVPEAAIVSVVFLDRVFGVYLPSLVGWAPLVRTDFSALVE